jgi:hypothetical protein
MKLMLRSFVLFVCLAASLASFASPRVDGIFSPGEWDSAQTLGLNVNLPEGGTAPARIYLMNDAKTLFVALRLPRERADLGTSFSVDLDANYDRRPSAGDDQMVVSHTAWDGSDTASDNVYYEGGRCTSGLCTGPDTDFAGINDVTGAVGYDGEYATYEMSKPLMSIDSANDATMLPRSSIALRFFVRLLSYDTNADTIYPARPLYVDYVITAPEVQPAADGIFTDHEYDGAQTIDVNVNLPEGGTAPGRLYLMNDAKTLYVALRVERARPDAATSFGVDLDSTYDRRTSAGDDQMLVSHNGWDGSNESYDNIYFQGGRCPAGSLCSGFDTDFAGINDVQGAVGYDGTYATYELAKPLMSYDSANDATMLSGSSIALQFFVRLLSSDNYADTFYPSYPSAGLYVDYVIR